MHPKQAEYQKRWRLKNREKIRLYQLEWRSKNKEKSRALQKRWRDKNPERVRELEKRYQKRRRPYRRHYRIKYKYGLSRDAYEQLLGSQGFRCAACKIDLNTLRTQDIHVDHCHKTQKIRGILCGPCNRSLGLMKDNADNLRLLAKYIESFKP